MEMIAGYFEIYDLTMAIQFSLNTGPVENISVEDVFKPVSVFY